MFVARDGRHELTTTDADRRRRCSELVERMLKTSRPADRLSAAVRRRDAARRAPAARRARRHHPRLPAVNIRKFVRPRHRLDDLVELGTLTAPGGARSSRPRVRAGLNILVAGGTQAGKTTMLNCLAARDPRRRAGGQRARRSSSSSSRYPDWVPMQTRQAGLEGTGEIALRDLVKEALRMRPVADDRRRGAAEECLDLLLALNSGLPGMCTIHANSAREALVKLCTLPLLAGENIGAVRGADGGRPASTSSYTSGSGRDGQRRVREIVARQRAGRGAGDRDRDDVRHGRRAVCAGPRGMLPHPERFAQAGLRPGRAADRVAAGRRLMGAPAGAVLRASACC